VPAAALAVVDALGALQSSGVPAAHAFFLRFPPSHDVRVRRRVTERLGDAGWADAPPTASERSDSFYVQIVRTLLVPALTADFRPRVAIGTRHGEIVLALAPDHAPLTVHNFLTLVNSGYYSGAASADSAAARWHRVVPNFVLQDGDPRGDGTGNPGYAIRDELNRLRYGRGVLGMALSGPDTGGGQFFITHAPQPHLDAGYTIFGRVVSGMDAADSVVQDDLILYIREVR
jgi:cyclophilin family peptidyl-prolyl cis-trans isomerase